jgi:transitional endoplasmic reticulum ATPase
MVAAPGPGGRKIWAEVVALAPGPVARLAERTAFRLDLPEPEARPYRGVGGLAAQIARVREMVELPIRRPDLFARLGIAPPKGVLFTGPPGSGKTLLARAVAEASEATFFQINGPEIVTKHYGDSEAKLREVFAAAARKAPSVVFIDEIDAIAPKRDQLSGEKQLERRLVAQLLTLMDGLSERGRVVVMAATNLPHALDPALRRPGRFDREIAFGAPDLAARRDILAVHFADAPLADDADLDGLAAVTSGYVGADLAALAREAALAALARAAAETGGADAVDASTLWIAQADIEAARAQVGPSALRETQLELPETRWSDIGGLSEAKAALVEAVIWPMRHPDAFRRLGIAPLSGLLLAGPPGGGKTLLARALAAESGAQFIAARGAQILSRFLGDAERAVAELFTKARHAAPCILFFDELDVLAPARGAADPALERVVGQLLVEIDGVAATRGVFVLGATNRPEAIDAALLRPGRLERVLTLAPPDAAARREILAVHAAAAPLSPEVDLDAVAEAARGWSGAELRGLCHEAARGALRRALRSGAPLDGEALTVTPLDFDAAFRQRRPETTP